MFLHEKLAKFWLRVAKRGADECWEWQAGKNKGGYGQTSEILGERLAHRVAYTIVHGTIPENVKILHSCDNPSCVNDRHLHTGTSLDNTTEMLARGRHKTREQRGEYNGNARLTDAQVAELRELGKSGADKYQLAIHFKISVAWADKLLRQKARG